MDDPEVIWRFAPNPKARSSFKYMMEYGKHFPERDDELWATTEARQKTCPHPHAFQLIFRVAEGSSPSEPEYEYAEVCPDCFYMKKEWA